MIEAFSEIKEKLWDTLKRRFEKYAGSNGEIKNSEIQILVRQMFKDVTQNEIQYFLKNIHKLDADNSGTVSFSQFANFLFYNHCGELGILSRHINNEKQKNRLINYQQFQNMLNTSTAFLQIKIPQKISKALFAKADLDSDQKITYMEYFQIVDTYICKSTVQLQKYGVKIIKQSVSYHTYTKTDIVYSAKIAKKCRFRNFIWSELEILYETYAMGRKVPMGEAKQLIEAIRPDFTEIQLIYALVSIYQIKGQYINFIEFASRFIYVVAQIGLSRFSINQSRSLRSLTLQNFNILMLNTFKHFNIKAITNSYITLIYKSILNKKSTVSYEMYLDWIAKYLSVAVYYGGAYDFPQDDINNEKGNKQFLELKLKPSFKPDIPSNLVPTISKFNFSNYDLAYLVRQRTIEQLTKFDANKDLQFSQSQIREALRVLFKQDQNEQNYVLRNEFRYDKNGDKIISYQELTNFIVQQHFGEIAIQRLHKKKFFSKGNLLKMNMQQFGKTLNFALQSLKLQVTSQIILLLFSEIDLDKDGWISYEEYFQFLQYYFGQKSFTAQYPKIQIKKPVDSYEKLMKLFKGLTGLQRFLKMLLQQLKIQFMVFSNNNNLSFESDEIQAILIHIFHFNQEQIQLVMSELFLFDVNFKKTVTFQDLSAFILSIYFVEIVCIRRFANFGKSGWRKGQISQSQFIQMIIETCYFIEIKPLKEDLIIIFKMIDTNKDGYITIQQYISFIRKYLGKALYYAQIDLPSPVKRKKTTEVSQQQFKFVGSIWDELKALFDKYDTDKKNYQTLQQFKAFVIEVLDEKSDSDLKYIFWNLFRLDANMDQKIEFEQFAPYVLKHAGQVALQRFHKQQIHGKSTLNEAELFIVISNAFAFLSTMPKDRNAVSQIYKRIKENKGVTYKGYIEWVDRAVATRFN